MRRQFLLAIVIAGGLVEAFPVAANGGVITFSDTVPKPPDEIPLETDWTRTVTIPQFDPSLGTLNSVEFILDGEVTGRIGYENWSASKGDTVSYYLSGDITLFRPDHSEIMTATFVTSGSESLPLFDGTIDYAGDSGTTHSNLSATGTTTSGPEPELGPYTGTGNIMLDVLADGTSKVEGGGNLYSFTHTLASATVTVRYNYDSSHAPEPSALAISLGMAASWGFAAVWRRRKAARKSAP